MKPFLKWAGGKSQLLDQYVHIYPNYFEKYYEIFLGGGAVFFDLYDLYGDNIKYTLSDSNSELINCWHVVKYYCKDLIDVLSSMESSHSEEYFYKIRSNQYSESKVANHRIFYAARMIYLNKTCFNGLYRVNKRNEFNVPIGSNKSSDKIPKIFDRDNLLSCSKILQKVNIETAKFNNSDRLRRIIEESEGYYTFVYMDPPYHPLNGKSNFTSYTTDNFEEKDQKELSRFYSRLNEASFFVMESNSDCEFIRNLYRNYNIHTVQAKRSINSKGSERGTVSELVITNY